LLAVGLTYKRARIVTSEISAITTECRCAVAKQARHERAANEGAEAAKRRQEQLEKEVREYHESEIATTNDPQTAADHTASEAERQLRGS
jgi:hypothetical protein